MVGRWIVWLPLNTNALTGCASGRGRPPEPAAFICGADGISATLALLTGLLVVVFFCLLVADRRIQ